MRLRGCRNTDQHTNSDMRPVIQSRTRFLLSVGALIVAVPLSLAMFTAYPRPQAFSPVRWTSWSILAAELFVCAFLAACLHVMSNRKRAIERTLAERTKALHAAAENLELAKRAAEKTEARYRKLLEISPDAILMCRNRVILVANEAARKLLRVNRAEDLVGRTFTDFVAPKFRAAAEEVSLRLYSTAMQLPQHKMQLLCGDTRVDVEIAAASYLDDEGANVQYVMRDISERKLAEQALPSSEEKFRQLAENIHEVFWTMSPAADEMLYISPAYEQVWGRTCDSLYRSPMSRVEAIHPDDLEQAQSLFARQMQGEPVDSEYRIRTPDGQEKWILDRAFPIRDQAGQLIRVVGIAEETTGRKRYEEELIQARDLAESANRAKSMFLATVIHDLRTPLNGILGFSELLEVEMADRGIHDWDEDVQNIRRAGAHMLALINEVVDFSKIESGDLELYPESFDIAALVQEVAARVEPLAAKNRVAVRVVSEPATLYGDKARIGQCLLNLLGNACKSTHDGRVLVEANADKTSDGGWYTVRVIDTGIGIQGKDRESLFSHFTQLDTSNSRKYSGAGMGLAISRRLSRLMGGDITVENAPGQGLRIHFAPSDRRCAETPDRRRRAGVFLEPGFGERLAHGGDLGGRRRRSQPGTSDAIFAPGGPSCASRAGRSGRRESGAGAHSGLDLDGSGPSRAGRLGGGPADQIEP